MKIFKIVQKNYATLGISALHRSNQKYSFNGRLLFGFLSHGFFIISQFVYIFNVTDGFMEYMETICIISGTILMFICLMTIVFKRDLLFEVIDNIEKFIETSVQYSRYISRFHKNKMIRIKFHRNCILFQGVKIHNQRHFS